MPSTLRPYISAGVVIVGAGLMAATPVAVSLSGHGTARDIMLTAGPGSDAFTIDGTTFDPFTTAADGTTSEGFDPVAALNTSPPLLSLGGGSASLGGGSSIPLAPQSFDMYSGTTSLGSIDTNEAVANLLGLSNTEFTVTGVTYADGVSTGLPSEGTVYDVLNLGGGTYNVYVATPDVTASDGTVTHGTVTDTLVTPNGTTDLSSLFTSNAANPLDAGAAFTGLQDSTSSTPDAFTIGTTTFDPFTTAADGTTTEGFAPVGPLAGIPPLLNIGGGTLLGNAASPGETPLAFAPQSFDVSTGTGSAATDAGTVNTAVAVTNLLGLPNTEFTVTALFPTTSAIQSALTSDLDFTGASFTAQDLANAIAAAESAGNLSFGTGDITSFDVLVALSGSGIDLTGSNITDDEIATALNGVSVADLPATGTVYDVFNLGGGWENVYTATPDAASGGTGDGTVTDTLVTPFGNVNLDSLFGGTNAANILDTGAALTGLSAGDSSMPDAFQLGGFVFDPTFTGSDGTTTEGFLPVFSLVGAAPLLNLGGGTLSLDGFSLPFDPQDFTVYNGHDDEIATMTGNINNVSTLLGLPNTEFTVASVTPVADLAANTALPTVGTVYDVLNLGNGWENVYIATPGADGTVTDTFITPYGNIDLSSLFGGINAADPLDPGAAVSGLDDAAQSGSTAATDLFSFLGL